MNQTRYAKAADFASAEPKRIIFGSVRRVLATEVGAKYSDSKGFTNVLKFTAQSGEDYQLESTSYGMTKAFLDAKLTPGDEVLVQLVILNDPYSEKKYYHWVVQRLDRPVNHTVQYDEPSYSAPTSDPWDTQPSNEDEQMTSEIPF